MPEIAHSPNECADPAGCPQHAEMAYKHWGCTCLWHCPGIIEPCATRADCPNPAHAQSAIDWAPLMVQAVPEVDPRTVIPEPEVRARPARPEEVPDVARKLLKKAKDGGFHGRVSYARGPRLDQYNKVVEISDSILIRGWHADARKFIAHYVTKTGQRGAKAGVTEWKYQVGYVHGTEGSCNVSTLYAYLVTAH